ncbi:MAG: hypothetical protein U1E35_03460 [Rhodospirillales bacterium]
MAETKPGPGAGRSSAAGGAGYLGGAAGSGALVGLLAAIAVLAAAIALGGRALSFVDVPSLLIVVGGTFAVLCVCFPLREVAAMLACVGSVMLDGAPDPHAAALKALRLAADARTHGLLHLEQRARRETHAPFLRKALTMVADGAGEAELEAVLRHDVLTASTRAAGRGGGAAARRRLRPGDGAHRHADRARADAGPAQRAAADRAGDGGSAADDILRCRPRQHGVLAAGGEAGAAGRRRGDDLPDLPDGRRLHQPAGKPRRLELLLDGVLPPGKHIRTFDR